MEKSELQIGLNLKNLETGKMDTICGFVSEGNGRLVDFKNDKTITNKDIRMFVNKFLAFGCDTLREHYEETFVFIRHDTEQSGNINNSHMCVTTHTLSELFLDYDVTP